MCGPVAVAAVMVGSALVGAYATYESGQTQKEFANFEAKQMQADAAAEKGDAQVEADRIRRMGKAAAAETNAALAASGQGLGSAGAMAINREVYRGAEEDAYFALIGGRDRAARLNTQAGLTQARGKANARGATMSAWAQVGQAGVTGYNGWKTAQANKGGG